jgi:hypothetical protein
VKNLSKIRFRSEILCVDPLPAYPAAQITKTKAPSSIPVITARDMILFAIFPPLNEIFHAVFNVIYGLQVVLANPRRSLLTP